MAWYNRLSKLDYPKMGKILILLMLLVEMSICLYLVISS